MVLDVGGVNILVSSAKMAMAEDEILFDDVYTLGDIVGKYVCL